MVRPAFGSFVMSTFLHGHRLHRRQHNRDFARCARFGGFTLVEILAVVVILGIASAIIIPQMGSRDDMRTTAAARTLVADLIYAQNQAISSGRMVYIKFDTANNKYTLLSTANSGGDVAINNPITQTTYTQLFNGSTGGWQGVTINSAVFNGADASYRPLSTIGFDEIGSPHVFS